MAIPNTPTTTENQNDPIRKQDEPNVPDKSADINVPINPNLANYAIAIREQTIENAYTPDDIDYYDDDLEYAYGPGTSSWGGIGVPIDRVEAEEELNKVAPIGVKPGRMERVRNRLSARKERAVARTKNRIKRFDRKVAPLIDKGLLEDAKWRREVNMKMAEKFARGVEKVLPGVMDDTNLQSPDGFDVRIQKEEENTPNRYEKKQFVRSRVTRRKTSDDDDDISSIPGVLSYLLKKAFGRAIEPVLSTARTARDYLKATRVGKATIRGVNAVKSVPKRLANLKTATTKKILETIEKTPALAKTAAVASATISKTSTVVGAVYKTTRVVGAGVSNASKSATSSIAPALAVGAVTGFNPAAMIVAGGVSFGLNVTNNTVNVMGRGSQVTTKMLKSIKDPFIYKELRRAHIANKLGPNGLEKLNQALSAKGMARGGALTKILQKYLNVRQGAIGAKLASRIATVTRSVNWGGGGALIGAVIGTALGGPVVGAALGAGAGIGAQVAAARIAPKIGQNAALFKMMGSGALRYGMNYFQMVQSAEWARRFLKEFRDKEFSEAWRQQMWGWRGAMNIANMGLFAWNYYSLRAVSTALITKVAASGFSRFGVTSGIGASLGSTKLISYLASPTALVGGAIGTVAGFALAGGGGAVALSTAITGAAIGGAVGTAIGMAIGTAIGGSVSFGFLAVPAASVGSYLGNTIGSFIGSVIGTWVGQRIERAAARAAAAVSGLLTAAGILSVIGDLSWGKGWNLAKMLALVLALVQLANILQSGGEQAAFFTGLQDGDASAQDNNSIYSELEVPIERLKFIYDEDVEEEIVFASSDTLGLDSTNSGYSIVKPSNELSNIALSKAYTLKKGFLDKFNKPSASSNGWNEDLYQQWKDCKEIHTINDFVCLEYVKLDKDNMYLSSNLIKETYSQYYSIQFSDGIDNSSKLKQYFVENQNYLDSRTISKMDKLEPGMVVFIGSEDNIEIERVGIIHEIGKDYIRTIEANTGKIDNYYTLNFNGRNINAHNFFGEFILGYGYIR